MDSDSQINIIESQVRECFGRVAWSHKTHEKCSDILLARHHRIKVFQIILSAITTTGILVVVFGDNKGVAIAAACVSGVLFALNAYVKGRDLGEISQKHAETASDLWDIREKYISLLTDIKARVISLDEIIARRDNLQNNLKSVYQGSPRTISKAYTEATKALKLNEELTFSNAEIDAFLPKEIRKESD